MNIFVVGTGHCGTTTFAKACRFATNRKVSHESASGGIYTFEYPEDHIEVDAPLAFWVPRLRSFYRGCRFVHLVRDKKPCIESLARNEALVCQWFGHMLYHFPEATPLDGALALYSVINESLRGEDVLQVRLEEIKIRWHEVWAWMGCEGDFARSLAEWDIKYHASPGNQG